MKFGRIVARSLSGNFTNTCQTPRLLPKTAHFSPSSSTPISKNPDFLSSKVQSCNGFVSSRDYTSSAQESKPSERVTTLVDEISGLTLLEVSDLTEILRKKLDISEMPVMGVMMPGMAFKGAAAKGGGAGKAEEKKAEKTAFDLKLEGGFEAGVKIKIIKEVRACTALGLKEAKDLVEKAPTLLKKGVTKEEAEKIIEKMKEVGAKVTME